MKYGFTDGIFKVFIDSEFAGRTAEDFFEFLSLSRKTRYLLIRDREVFLDGEALKDASALLQNGDILSLKLKEEEVDYTPADEPCETVYEDDLVYVVHKPAGIIVHDQENSLANMAARYQLEKGIKAPVRYIHRLDRETSGLVLFVKHPLFTALFDRMLAEREISRRYLAIVKGKLPKEHKTVFKDPIGRNRHQAGHYIVSPSGKPAVTHVEILKEKGPYALVKAELETGRTHQIRVHLSYHHLPIVNDAFYGIRDSAFPQMGLWAYQLVFTDPFTHRKITVNDTANEMFSYFD